MNFEQIIQDTYQKIKNIDDQGKSASYIPELASVDSEKFGVHISTIDQVNFGVGNCYEKFSIQSIAKVLSFSLAYNIIGNKIWDRVGVEPSGTPFNSLVQLEADNCIPRNPFLNGGALVVSDILLSNLENPKEEFLEFVRSISNNITLNY
jgi:glutaminase